MPIRALLATAVSAVVLASVVATPTAASAHDVLAATAPAAESTVDGSTDQVSLTFSEAPLAGLESGIVVRVTGPRGADVASGDVDVDGSTLRTTADLTAAGAYTVTWRSVSVDGHPISGSYRFTSTGSSTLTPSASAPTSTPTPTPTSSGPAVADASAAASGPGATPWVLGGIAVLVAAGLVAALLVARRRTVTGD